MFREKNKNRCKTLIVPAVLAGGICGLAASAEASTETKVKLCNDHSEKIFVSVAYEPEAGQPVMARGWWAVDSNQCNEVTLPLGSDKILLHGQASSQLLQWVGDKSLCVDENDKFDFNDAATMACDTGHLDKRGFKELSVTSLTGSEAGAVATYKFKSAEAVKVGPMLKICNDTAEEAYISLAQKHSSVAETIVDGWYSIKPQTCYETRRVKSANELYLYANSSRDKVTWRGDVPLCTDDVDGFSFDNASSRECNGLNERQYLFRKINMTDTPEFEYRLRAEDAHKTRSSVDLCNTNTEELFASIMVKDPNIAGQNIALGWYNIEPGKCVDDIAVDADAIGLHVEDELRFVLVEGEETACVNTDDAFEFSRATTMVCEGEHLELVKFKTIMIPAGDARVDLP